MKTAFRKSFTRDLRNIKNQRVLRNVRAAIEQVEAAARLNDISNLKKISGAANLFRIRIGEYRIGLAVEKQTVEFVRCLHRRDLYRFFP
jgi:mRNA interferase RelE/StbE